jgi:hypothetical protein
MTLSITMLCYHAECRYAECRSFIYYYAESQYDVCHYAECRYAGCRDTCGKHLSNVVALYKMSQSILRLIVNNAINFMILLPLPLSPLKINKVVKRSSSHGSNLEAFTFFGRQPSFLIERTTHTRTRFEFLQAAWPMPLYFHLTIKPRFCVCTDH